MSGPTADSAVATARYGVIDIGSNSIRLAIFDALRRAPQPFFNEKALCAIGRGVRRTGKLSPDGAARALETLERFGALARAMGAAPVDAVATAAVRDAADGAAFAREAGRRSGFEVRVLSGAEEAEFAAAGVLSGMPQADGVMGDLGGGSLELVRFDAGRAAEHATLPLGPLSLLEESDGDFDRARAVIDAALSGLPWLKDAAGAELYAVGGNWRALARAHMAQQGYPLRVIHHYRLARGDAAALVARLARETPDALAGFDGVPARRLDLLPLAALAMERTLRAAAPRAVTFSALGLREGLAHMRLSAQRRAEDPLLAACRDIAARLARFPDHGDELFEWTGALFPDETAGERRLRRAACAIGDIGWRAHPDARAEQASAEALYAPALYASHPERCFLAGAVFARYANRESGGKLRAASERLLAPETRRRARIVGLAARLGEALSGGVPGILRRFPLSLEAHPPTLRLRRAPGDEAMLGESVMRRFETLAAEMGCAPERGPL